MDRYEYEESTGFIVDNEKYGAIIMSIKHQRLGKQVVKMLNEKEDEIRKLKKMQGDMNE